MRYYTDEQLEVYKVKLQQSEKPKETKPAEQKYVPVTCNIFLGLDYTDLVQLQLIGEAIKFNSPIDDCIRTAIKVFIEDNLDKL